MSHGIGTDRRPWLIISKREAEACLKVIRRHLTGTRLFDDVDLVRAERVMTRQLEFIQGGDGEEPNVITTLVREQRS